MSYAQILRDAAVNRLGAATTNFDEKDGDLWRWHRYSCNAVRFAYGKATDKTYAVAKWYYKTVLCADQPSFPAHMPGVPEKDTQNVRFMLLLFASYLAEDLDL